MGFLLVMVVVVFVLFLSRLLAQRGTWTPNPEIKSHWLYQLSQPGTSPPGLLFLNCWKPASRQLSGRTHPVHQPRLDLKVKGSHWAHWLGTKPPVRKENRWRLTRGCSQVAVDQQQAPAERQDVCEPNCKYRHISAERAGEVQGAESLLLCPLVSRIRQHHRANQELRTTPQSLILIQHIICTRHWGKCLYEISHVSFTLILRGRYS